MSKQPFICHCGFNTMDTKKALEHSREHEMNENKLSREDMIEIDVFLQKRPQEIIKHLESMSTVYIDATHIAKRTNRFRYYHRQIVAKIKFLLIPIPEMERAKFIEEKVIELYDIIIKCPPKLYKHFIFQHIASVLKRYDELKEKK